MTPDSRDSIDSRYVFRDVKLRYFVKIRGVIIIFRREQRGIDDDLILVVDVVGRSERCC